MLVKKMKNINFWVENSLNFGRERNQCLTSTVKLIT